MVDMNRIAVFIFAVNAAMFALTGLDKRRAKRGEYRIRENLLLLGALLGGAGGVLSAMVMFRHKTRKKAFRIGVPILFFVNLLAMYAMHAEKIRF